MKRTLLILVMLVAALGLAGSALAQRGTYAGVSFDFRGGGGFLAGLTGHIGSDDLSPHFGIRGDLGLLFSGPAGFEIGANALYHNRLGSSAPLELYLGGGPRLFFVGGPDFALGFLGGLEYGIEPDISIYGEFGLDVVVAPSSGALFGLGFGVNFYL